jgi:hypothetical protein
VSEALPDLLGRHAEALRRINDAIEKGDQREVKAWRTVYERQSEQLYQAGYYEQNKPVEKPE